MVLPVLYDFRLQQKDATFYFQTAISDYSAIYGSFAAIPLFLLWVQISWSIALFGAELCYHASAE